MNDFNPYEVSRLRSDGRRPGRLTEADRADVARRLAGLRGTRLDAAIAEEAARRGVCRPWIEAVARKGA